MVVHSTPLFFWTAIIILIAIDDECLGQQVAIPVGQTAILPCHVEIQGSVAVAWKDKELTTLTLNGEVLVPDRRYSVLRRYLNDWDLQITDSRVSDAGNYTCCVVIGQDCQAFRTVFLQIHIPPSLSFVSADVTLSLGRSTNLVCNATGIPKPTIKWLLDGNNPASILIGNRTKELTSGSVYTIKNATIRDAGRYECQADNGVRPPASAFIQVSVTFKPQASVPYREVRQNPGSETLLECLVRSNPTGSIHWEKNGKKLENVPNKYRVYSWKGNDLYQTFISLVIYNLVTDDFTSYQCVASNDFGVSMDSAVISAWHNGTLRILSTPKDSIIETGNDIIFDCSVEGMAKTDRLIWWRIETDSRRHVKIFDSLTNGGLWADDPKGKVKYGIVGRFNLAVKAVSLYDAGTYVCDVLGLGNYTATLTVIGPGNSVGPDCGALTKTSNNTIIIVVVVVAACIIIFITVVFLIVRHYRKKLAESRGIKPVAASVRTEKYNSIFPSS